MSKMKTYKFNKLYEMSSGISSKPEQAGHGTPFLSFSTVFKNHFLPDQLPDLMSISENEKIIYSIKEGDIFLTRTSETLDELGMSSVAIKDYQEASYSGFLKRLRPLQNNITYHKFMAFYLRSELFRKTMNNNAIMTLRASLNEQIFSYLDLILPPYSEQKKIGDLLFSLNQKIELNNKINTELESIAKTLYDYWFVQFDFPISKEQAVAMGNPELKGKPYKTSGGKMVWNEVLKKDIPESWKVDQLGNLGNFKNGVNYDPSNPGEIACPIINVRNISASSFFLKNEDLDIIYLKKSDVQKYSVHEGSIIIARSGIPGATRLIADIEKNTLYCGFAIHYELDDLENKIPVFFFLKSIEQLIKNGSGGTILKNVNQATLNALKFSLPKKKTLIKQFNVCIEPLFTKTNLIQKENKKLASLRDWLLPMLMNGQVTIADAESQVKEAVSELTIPENKKGFAKQVLAGKIVSVFNKDPHFTDIKFQKIQFLAEHIIGADLNLNYYYQAAGPYDNKFMHTIFTNFRAQKWFDKQSSRFIPLEKQEKIDEYYQEYFSLADEQLNRLFSLLVPKTEAEAEIIATLYAVWNNRIIGNKVISEKELIQDFYQWSNRKQQYTEDQIKTAILWLKEHHLEPTGFGKLIKFAKGKHQD